MINISKDGKTVKIKIDYHIPYGTDWTSTFTNTMENDHSAEMLFAVLLDALHKRTTEIRRESYNEGWKDKSAKQAKKDWFSCQM